jgi:hypothetical protein
VVTKVNIDQSDATANGDIVGGDKSTTHHHHYSADQRTGLIEQLMHRLADEIKNDQRVRDMVENLQRFYNRKSVDGIDGLEAKLTAGSRSHELLDALEQKERFSKLLEKWSLYASAQQIFAYLLAKAEHEFRFMVLPQITILNEVCINQLVSERIIYPLVDEVGDGVFNVDPGIVMGMIYWLAEQCFVRWHK